MMQSNDLDESSTGFYSKFFEEAPFGVHVYRLEDANDEESFVLIAANKCSEKLTGRNLDDVLNKRIFDVLPSLRNKKTITFFHKVLQTGQAAIFEDLGYKDKHVLGEAWDVRIFPLAKDCLGVAFDIITDRIKNQEKLEFQSKLIENISDAVMSSDMDFVTQSWSKGAERVYGWKAEEVIGKHGLEVLRPQNKTQEDFLKATEDMLRDGYWYGEMIQKHKDGRDLAISISSSLVKNYKGDPIGIVTVNRDVTRQRSIEKKLLDSYKYLGLLNRKINVLLNLNKGDYIKNRGDVMDFIFDAIEKVFEAKISLLYSYDLDKKEFCLIKSIGVEEDHKKEFSLLSAKMCKDLNVLIDQKERFIKRFEDCKSATLNGMSGGFLFFPLVSGGVLSGGLVVVLEDIEKISTQELDFFELFAAQISLVLGEIEDFQI